MVQRINRKTINWKAWISLAILAVLALVYYAPALTAQFVGDNDYWSNLLPIIHYRNSILNEHTLPLYTDLWYGGRAQWQNPLWSFLYLPATLIWLITPLNWGARIVIGLHILFSLMAGRKVSSLFLDSEVGRIPTAVVLTAPMLPALLAGHLEKVMAWGWLLFSIYFLLNESHSFLRRGVCSGLCWGIIALTGANYHFFYAGLLLVPLALSYKKIGLLFSLIGGASIGLLHLPTVWHLIGVERANSAFSISYYKTSILGIITSLSAGFAKPIGWESWALIGVPVVYLFLRSFLSDLKGSFTHRTHALTSQKISLLIALLVFILLTTGIAYQENHLLDTFRVPIRAIALIAVVVVLYVLMSYKPNPSTSSNPKQATIINWFLIASAIQAGFLTYNYLGPRGAVHSPYDTEAQKLVEILRDDQAESVWISTQELSIMYIHVILTDHGIALPNVYYGDMGQVIPVQGPYCGYSFDHLISPSTRGDIKLVSDITYQVLGSIPSDNLQPIDQLTLDAQTYIIYRVVCDQN